MGSSPTNSTTSAKTAAVSNTPGLLGAPLRRVRHGAGLCDGGVSGRSERLVAITFARRGQTARRLPRGTVRVVVPLRGPATVRWLWRLCNRLVPPPRRRGTVAELACPVLLHLGGRSLEFLFMFSGQCERLWHGAHSLTWTRLLVGLAPFGHDHPADTPNLGRFSFRGDMGGVRGIERVRAHQKTMEVGVGVGVMCARVHWKFTNCHGLRRDVWRDWRELRLGNEARRGEGCLNLNDTRGR